MKQQQRDDNIKALALLMRDMLSSLSEIDALEKIKTLQSIVVGAMTRIRECAEFIQAYAQHGFWSKFTHLLSIQPPINWIRSLRSSIALEQHGGNDGEI
jgi:hypothetical protein